MSVDESTVGEPVARLGPTKPDLDGNGLSHPARYSRALLPVFREYLTGCRMVLDPFAGTGRIHELGPPWVTVGVEIEPEWARLHPGTVIGNALNLEFDDEFFDAVCTSPTYGNRMADHHDARDGSTRRTYKHDLGRDLHPDNSGQLHWGPEYRDFHERAWAEAVRVLRPGGRFLLNVKNHIRSGVEQSVVEWHRDFLCDVGLTLVAHEHVRTPSNRAGVNRGVRVDHESVLVFDKPGWPQAVQNRKPPIT